MSRNALFLAGSAVIALALLVLPAQAHPPGHGSKPLGAAAAPATEDAPGNHGMFMVGTKTLFLTHMPMFTDERHMYQMVLRVRLPDTAVALYQKLRAANPEKPYNLINVDSDKFTLPDIKSGKVTSFKATLYDGYSNDNGGTPGPVLLDQIPVTIEAVVLFRHFNFGINRPPRLIYTLFGADGEAHMTHYIAQDPDFQHIVTLAAPPSGFSDAQLQAGIDLDFTDVSSKPILCAPPIKAAVYKTLFAGRPDAPVMLDLTKGTHSIWYSTGNLLNAKDPCA